MASSELWVGILTAATAIGASYLTARGMSKAALAQARTMTTFDALREQREHRRSAYRQMMACVHAFSEICWRLLDVDAAGDPDAKQRLLAQIHERIGPAVSDMTRAAREVLLDGPAEVAEAAEEVRMMALRLEAMLKALGIEQDLQRRHEYDRAYQTFLETYAGFVGTARNALDVRSGAV
jgi:hypothetical protein